MLTGALVAAPATAAFQAPAPASPKAPDDAAKPAPKPATNDEEPRGLRLREPAAEDGFTLIAPLNSHDIHLIDMDGKVVHTWKTGLAPGGATEMLPNGNLLRCARKPENPRFHGGGIGGWIHELDWDGKVVWEYELANAQLTQHHDMARMPNGNLLVIAWEYHGPEEAAERGRDPRFRHKEGLWSDVILEIEPVRPVGGKVVWTWRAWDHLVQDLDPKAPNYGKLAENVGRIDINADHRYLPVELTDEERERRQKIEEQMRAVGYTGGDAPPPPDEKDGQKGPPPGPKISSDWLHTNSIDHLASEDLIVVSTPHLSEVWVIDHVTTTAEAAGSTGGRLGRGGDLVFRWGNARNYGLGSEADQRLFDQHDATWQPGLRAGELRLLVFNNNVGLPGKERSTVDEVVLPYERERGFHRDNGLAFGPRSAIWSYSDAKRFHSSFISGAQRLHGGNTLICEGAKGRVFEVDRDGKVVWDYWSPLGGEIEPSPQGGKAPPKALFRAQRISRDHAGVKGKL